MEWNNDDDDEQVGPVALANTPQENFNNIQGLALTMPIGLNLNISPSFAAMLEELLSDDVNSSSNYNMAKPKGRQEFKSSNFPMLSIIIGKWRFTPKYEGNLMAKVYFKKKRLIWELLLVDDTLKSKIEIEWDNISAIKATTHNHHSKTLLEVQLKKPPSFHREPKVKPRKQTSWSPVSDFTDGQASSVRVHHLLFELGVLDAHYTHLLQSDSRLFQLSQEPFPHEASIYFDSAGVGEGPSIPPQNPNLTVMGEPHNIDPTTSLQVMGQMRQVWDMPADLSNQQGLAVASQRQAHHGNMLPNHDPTLVKQINPGHLMNDQSITCPNPLHHPTEKPLRIMKFPTFHYNMDRSEAQIPRSLRLGNDNNSLQRLHGEIPHHSHVEDAAPLNCWMPTWQEPNPNVVGCSSSSYRGNNPMVNDSVGNINSIIGGNNHGDASDLNPINGGNNSVMNGHVGDFSSILGGNNHGGASDLNSIINVGNNSVMNGGNVGDLSSIIGGINHGDASDPNAIINGGNNSVMNGNVRDLSSILGANNHGGAGDLNSIIYGGNNLMMNSNVGYLNSILGGNNHGNASSVRVRSIVGGNNRVVNGDASNARYLSSIVPEYHGKV